MPDIVSIDEFFLPKLVEDDFKRKFIHITPTVKHCVVAQKMGVILGNQYYTEGEIKFYVLKGEVEFKMEDVFTKERRTRILFPRTGLVMKSYTAMALLPTPLSQFLLIFEREYNPQAYHDYEIAW